MTCNVYARTLFDPEGLLRDKVASGISLISRGQRTLKFLIEVLLSAETFKALFNAILNEFGGTDMLNFGNHSYLFKRSWL